jgi:hypothetical protein
VTNLLHGHIITGMSTRLFFYLSIFTTCFISTVVRKRNERENFFYIKIDYLTGMMHSSIYEFPYSGSHTSSIPFLNYNPNQYSNFDMYNTPQITMNRGNNTVVYHLPGLFRFFQLSKKFELKDYVLQIIFRSI